MEFEESIEINTNAESIYNLYKDVTNWNTWNYDVKISTLSGKLRVGAIGTLQLKKGPKAVMTLIEVAPNKSLTFRTSLPLCSVLFKQTLIKKKKTVQVHHKISYTGLLSPLYYRIYGLQSKVNLPITLMNVKERTENKIMEKTENTQ